MVKMHATTGLPYIIEGGHERLLYALPRVGGYKIQTWRAAGKPNVPMTSWAAKDLRNYWSPILDQNGHGCHEEGTEVLTEHGWQDWSAWDGSSLLATVNPDTQALEFQRATRRQAIEYDGPMVYSSNRRVDFAVTPNHRMLVRKWDEQQRTLAPNYSFTTADNLGWYAGLMAAPTGFVGADLQSLAVGNREYAGDDFVALVALIVSDGWAGGTTHTRNRVSFCCFREDRMDMVRALAGRLGLHEQPGRPGVWAWSDGALAAWLRQHAYTAAGLGASNKRIPDLFKNVSIRQIEHFLRYFGDQSIDRRQGGRRFYSVSQRLIDDLQELLLRCGKRGSIYEREARRSVMADGRVVQGNFRERVLNEATADQLSLDKKKHISTDRYKGLVYCATMPNGTLITRRNGSVLISGNSCVGHGSASGFMRARSLAGQPKVQLSSCYIYGCLNGGRDEGAVVSDAGALIQKGVCLETTVPEGKIYKSQFPANADAEASKYQAEEIYAAESFEDLGSGMMMDFIPVIGILVGSNFGQLDKNGVAPLPAGGGGGHCLTNCGMVFNTDLKEWVFDTQNSWGTTFGRNGFCYLRQGHYENSRMPLDAFLIKAVKTSPGDDVPPGVTTGGSDDQPPDIAA